MRIAAVAILLASLLAGCSARDGPAEDDDGPGVASDLLSFLPEVDLPQRAGGAEPNIAALPDGTLFLTVPVGGSTKPNVQEGSAYLWRSRDGGQAWDVLRSPDVDEVPAENAPQAGAFCSCDADVTTSPDGWVYYSDWWIGAAGLGPGNYLVESSSDGGDTWTANSVPIPQNLLAGMDRQWLLAGPDGFVALYYSFFAPTPAASLPVPVFGLDRPGQAIEAVFSSDHGESWSDPVSIVPASDNGYQIGHPRLAAGGNVWMPYGLVEPDQDVDFWRAPSEVRVAIVTPTGAPVDDVLVAAAPEGFDNLWAVQGAQDPHTGRAYAVWAARVDDNHSAVFASFSDDLATWSAPHALDATGINVLPWADASRGNVTFGWYGADMVGNPTNATHAAEARWHAYAAEWLAGDDLAAAVPIQVSVEPVKTGPMCPRGAACGGDRELLDYVSMVYAPDGRLHYAFARSTGSDAFVHVRTGQHA